MADKYGIDSHKLVFHPERVADWLKGENIYPIYIESSPSGICNHRCTFCGLDFMEYQRRFLDTGIFKERLTELGQLGLKSMMFGGEGEPLLHRDMADIAEHTKASGIDVAFTTNAVLLNEARAERILPVTEWIKVSLNAGTAGTYSKIHRTKESDFDTVIRNMERAAGIKRKKGYGCTLGIQILLLPENKDEVLTLARAARDIGMDYLVVKPYSQHPQSKTMDYGSVSYADMSELADELDSLNTTEFSAIFREKAMSKWDEGEKEYEHCIALPFWSYIDAGGNVWGCSVFIEDERFYYGNIHENSFREIWEGERRRESLRWVLEELDAGKCRVNCRMDEINTYLWKLKHKPLHMNFI